jgi:addiction module HigA family antidote
MTKHLPPMHPGEVLREEFLEPMSITPYALAKAIGVPRTRIERIAAERVGITADTAIRLGKFFRTSPEFWMNLQTRFDLLSASKSIGREIEKIVPTQTDAAA